MSSESELNVDDLHKLEELYDCRSAALKEFEDKAKGRSEYDSEFAQSELHKMTCRIENFEARNPEAAAAYHAE
jgi:hypothetical protein